MSYNHSQSVQERRVKVCQAPLREREAQYDGYAVQSYLQKMERLSFLSCEQEQQIERQMASEDPMVQEDARCQLLQTHMHLVINIAKNYPANQLSMLELIREGNLGLMRAVQHFDCKMLESFTTYATNCICEAISKAMEK